MLRRIGPIAAVTRSISRSNLQYHASPDIWELRHRCILIRLGCHAKHSTSAALHPAKVEERLLSEKLSDKDVRNLNGRLTFTSTNSLKLVIPLPQKLNTIAFLLHAQQPLSYLETLIRNELPEQNPDLKITFWDVHKHSTWSTGIQMSDFIREGAATRKFCISLADKVDSSEITVNVPSFEDRTVFLRTQLGRLTDRVQDQYRIKTECDELARKTAQTYAVCGMAGLVSYWVAVFTLTFYTPLGWDVMEPVTYLTSLSALIGGYCWFLYHNRDVSYSSVLHTAATVRQQRLYKQRGFNISQWRDLIEEGKTLRKEIQRIATEYNVEWTEAGDTHISNASVEASDVLIRASRKDKQRSKSDKEEDLEDDGEINGSNEVNPGSRDRN